MKKKMITFLMAVLLVMSSVPIPAEAAVSSGTLIMLNATNFPDSEFRKYLSEEYDTDGDGKINPAEVNQIEIYEYDKADEDMVKSLKGIELFPDLSILIFEGNTQLKNLDVSKNPNLRELYCSGDQLTSLDVSKNPNLVFLVCENNELTSLDVSKNPDLGILVCSNNRLTSLDVSKNPYLLELWCIGNQLTSLNLSQNPELYNLYCNDNQISYLDLSNNKELTFCDFDGHFKKLIISTDNLVRLTLWKSEKIADFSIIEGIDFSMVKDSRFNKTTRTVDVTKLYLFEESELDYNIYVWDRDESGLPFDIWFRDPDTSSSPASNVSVSYRTHVQSIGWQPYVSNGAMAGTSGQAKRLEGININVSGNPNLGIQYTTHVQSYGWLPWSSNGDMSGTEGEAKRLEAIKIQLTGADKDKYDVYYRVHAQSYGWIGWAMNGAPAGTAGYAKRLEGIQILVVKKGEMIDQNQGGITSARSEAYIALAGSSPVVGAAATSNTDPTIGGAANPNVSYRTHVQSFGWQGWKYNGQMSGTSGQAKRLEGINIKLTNKPYSGGICYTTHVQSYGWQGDINNSATWKKDGEMAGTSGQAKRLEAIMIKLTGEMADHYDVYYRVHAQSYGWLGWAKNGDPAGTAGCAKRLEGIQIVLVPKGGAAPSNGYGGITSANGQAYIAK